MTSLVPTGGAGDDGIDALQRRVAQLERLLAQRAAASARAQAELAAFRLRYRREVGSLHEELDNLHRAIAEAELDEISRRLQEESRTGDSPPAGSRREPAPRYSSDAVRRLFRDVAKAIHPDLANGDDTRARRHSLMVEANRAYALGDEEQLRSILRTWENSPEAVRAGDPEAARLRLVRRIAQIEQQLAVYDEEEESMRTSPLGQLKTMVEAASAQGKDLIADNVTRLKRDIVAARNRLDATLWNP